MAFDFSTFAAPQYSLDKEVPIEWIAEYIHGYWIGDYRLVISSSPLEYVIETKTSKKRYSYDDLVEAVALWGEEDGSEFGLSLVAGGSEDFFRNHDKLLTEENVKSLLQGLA